MRGVNEQDRDGAASHAPDQDATDVAHEDDAGRLNGGRKSRRSRAMAGRPGYRLLLMLQRMNAELEYYAARMRRSAGVRRTDMHAVAAVIDAERHGQEMTPGRLGGMLGLSSSSVTALVDRLCEAGHLDRGIARSDARRVALHSNARGRHVGEDLFEPLDHALMAVFDRYSRDELEVFSRIVTDLTSATAGAGHDGGRTVTGNGAHANGNGTNGAHAKGSGAGAHPNGSGTSHGDANGTPTGARGDGVRR